MVHAALLALSAHIEGEPLSDSDWQALRMLASNFADLIEFGFDDRKLAALASLWLDRGLSPVIN